MKILAVHLADKKEAAVSQLDIWRIWRPLRELRKHIDWEIDEWPTYIKDYEKRNKDVSFNEKEVEKAAAAMSKYDIVWSSYIPFLNPMMYAFVRMCCDKYGIKMVLDCDDNLFAINEDNFGWWTKMSHEQTFNCQQFIRDVPYITTTNEKLAQVFRKHRTKRDPKSVIVVPNYVSLDYKHKPFDNGDKIVIGYFGGASHFNDLHQTGFTKGLAKLMHENKNVYFKSAGIYIEDYLPKARYEYLEGEKGHKWTDSMFGKLNFDISVGPLTDTLFNDGKSDIKWQETAMIPAVFVGSKVGPYARTVKHMEDGILVENTEDDWYEALKLLVDNSELRNRLRDNARMRVMRSFLIENNWGPLRVAMDSVYKQGEFYSLKEKNES